MAFPLLVSEPSGSNISSRPKTTPFNKQLALLMVDDDKTTKIV